MTNSNNKGKNYERKIAKILSEWVGFELIRTPMSGAWQGTSGDILPKDRSQYFPFVVECKNNEGWNFNQILNGKGLFYDWIDQVIEEVAKDYEITQEHRWPVLVFSRNYYSDYIAIPDFHVLYYNGYRQCMRIDVGGDIFFVTELSQFIEEISYNNFISLADNAYFLNSSPDDL